jgi:hypothetical protein
MRCVITETYDEKFDALAELSVPNHRAYCRKHGYEYNLHCASFKGTSTFANAYLNYIRQMLPFYDMIVSIELDVLFMRTDISIESVFPEENEQQIALTGKIDGADCSVNNGVMFWRNRQSSLDLLDAIIVNQKEISAHPLTWQWYLHNAIHDRLPISRSIRIVDQHIMNTYFREYREGDFIMHAYFATMEEKLSVIKSYLLEVK